MAGMDRSAANVAEQMRLQKALRESEILRELADILNSSLDLKHILQELVKRTTELCEVNRCAVWLLEETRLNFQPTTYYIAESNVASSVVKSADAIWYRTPLAMNSSMIQHLLAAGGMSAIEDLRTEPEMGALAATFQTYSVLLIALMREGQPVGLLSLDNPGTVQTFSQQQQQLARAIGQQATIAIENARLYQQAQDQQVRARAIYQVAMTVNSGEELPVVLRLATRHLMQSLRANDGLVMLMEPDQVTLRLVKSEIRESAQNAAPSMALLEALPHWRQAACTGQSLLVTDEQAQEEEISWFQRHNLKNMLIVPLMSGSSHQGVNKDWSDELEEHFSGEEKIQPRAGEDCLGLIVIFYTRARKLSRGEYAFTHDIAAQCALAIKKTYVLRDARQALETFLHIAEDISLSHSTDIRDVLQSVLEKALKTLHCTRGTVYLYDQEEQTFNLAFSLGFLSEEKSLWLEQQQSWLNPQSEQGRHSYDLLFSGHAILIKAEEGSPFEHTMVLAAPIRHNQQVLGLIFLDRLFSAKSSQSQPPALFTNWDITIAEGIAQLAGVVMEQTRWQQEAIKARSSESAMREADALKDEFLAITAHEFRNPLAVILGRSQASLRTLRRNRKDEATTALPSSIEEHLEIIASQAKQLNNIVATFLDAARINRGQLALKSEIIDLAEIAHQVVKEQANVVEGHKISCQVEEAEASYRIVGDKARLAQIIANLVENAIKYSPLGGPVTVRLRRYRNAESLEMIEICVEDKGIGIPSEVQAWLFERFYRAPNVIGSETRGVGLGLYIVGQLVQAHKGSIRVESTGIMGEGSRFIFSLPAHSETEGLALEPLP